VTGSDYSAAGVRGQGEALSSVMRHLAPSLNFPQDIQTLTTFGHYASVLRLTSDVAIAVSTDGVGSKTIIASRLGRYDTIGFDCVAMNVNDVICVGARPIAMVDYIGVHTLDPRRVDDLLRGLGAAAKEAGVAIPGGEMAQLPEVIGSDGSTRGDPTAFDLVGTCVGVLHPDDLVLGRGIEPGDVVIGIASSGIHSNGLTLARRVLLGIAGLTLDQEVPSLGGTVGEALLRPTEIYVRAVLALWDRGIRPTGLAHITSDGFVNLCRLEAPVGYELDRLPGTPAIFDLIRSAGDVADEEMYRVFNMGVGFVVITRPDTETDVLGALEGAGYEAQTIGRVTDEAGVVRLTEVGLAGRLSDGDSVFERSS